MPLVRTTVRNVYGLGTPELHRDTDKEDPKAVLDGVAVAGLVGILRQLGDLAEFAAEVFHGLQEQVMVTSSRSNKLVARLQKIEAALPPLEKSVLAQQSHLHFAYTAGSNWHARIRSEQNHFIYNDLPRFIMDSYEECHGPPRLHLLDKFDPGGPGSCLKRYSDPTFFKRASVGSDEEYIDKVLKEKKGRKIKKKRSSRRNGEVSRSASMPNYGSRMPLSSRNLDRRPSLVHSFSMYDNTLKSDGDSRHGSGLMERVSQPSFATQPEDGKSETVSSPVKMQHNQSFDYSFLEEKSDHAYNDIGNDLSQELTDFVSTSVAWNLKMQPDTLESKGSFDSISQLHHNNMSQESKGSFGSISQLHDNNMLDHAFPDERGDVVYDDICNSVAEEQAGHCTSFVTWNDKTEREKQESREFSSQFQIHHHALPDCASPDRRGDDEYSDRGNSFTEDQIDHNLLSVALSGKMRSAEAESKEIFYSPLQMNPSTSREDASPDEKLWVISDEESNNFPPEQVVPSSPFLTSSVKNERLDLIIQKYDVDESLETRQENLLLDTQVLDLATSENIEQSSEPKAEIIPRSISYESQVDDIESETDNFMDALNTYESESETDLDCQRKREMVLESSLKTESSLNGNLGNRADLSDRNLSIPTPEAAGIKSPENSGFGGNTNLASADSDPGAFSSSEKVKYEEIPENISSEFGEFLLPPQIARITLKPDSSIGVPSSKRSNILETSQEEPLVSNHITSSPRNPVSALPVVNKIQCGPSDSEKPPPLLLGTPSVKFWTNGGLLGLEPSKPPDGVINSVGQVYEANQNEVVVTSRQDPVPSSERHAGKQDNVQNTSREKADYQNSGQAVAFSINNISSRFSAKDLDVKLDKLSNLYQQNCTDKPLHSPLNGSGMASRTTGPVSPESLTIGAGQENGKNSSRILELGNRLLTNGFHGKLSLGWNDNTDSVSSLNTGSNEPINDYQHFMGRTIKDFPGRGSPFTSPSSSPPLGHMKISFQPIDSIETSKLKLRFPDRSSIHESNSDMFPSFQLVPEPSIPLQEVGSDSDDDTFSRSSPDLSEDYLSHQSESNSEQWEFGNSPNLKDHEVYNALHRISLTESTSTSFENDRTAHQDLHACSGRHIPFAEYSLEDSQSDNLFDLPVLDTQHSSFKHGVGNASSARDFLEQLSGKESTPPPPPLPPMQWQSMQSHSDDEQDDLHLFSENRDVFDHKKPGSTISHQPKPPPFKQNQVIEAALKSKQPHSIDTTGQQFADHAENGRGVNEKDDFLHQIRAKSFNLRRTVPAKPTGTTGPPANVKVTAILEKANAIRQAVGSDDGEDNWSDT
ncbi:SCAR-like protein 2 isoform X1 [Lycium ferocissimum]|uniref:SCAR-like protein 2 isoform X1 n=2 Tax=Lycium ferocissimum TaxID=112874 RepID=UPI0028166A50|nr:SCAR-like protein 2 isoform X1 [Lycium ferocissimum]